jgi:hypothetical protein
VVFELESARAWRENIWLAWRNGQIVRRVDDGRVEIDVNADVVGWDQHRLTRQRLYNTTGKPIEVEIRRSFSGDVVFRHGGLEAVNHDFRTVQIETTVAAGEDRRLAYELVEAHGRNHKQNRVRIEEGEIGGGH